MVNKYMLFILGHYKVEMFDRNVNDYVPTVYGLGMHVEVSDPEDKVVMSRVRYQRCTQKKQHAYMVIHLQYHGFLPFFLVHHQSFQKAELFKFYC